jgi:hypothetical protein
MNGRASGMTRRAGFIRRFRSAENFDREEKRTCGMHSLIAPM